MRIRFAAIAIVAVLLLSGLVLAQPPDCTTKECAHLPLIKVSGLDEETATTTIEQPTWTPTGTPSPTATAVPVTLISNGDFEQGNTNWTEARPGIITGGLPSGTTPHSGQWVARLTDASLGDSVYRTLTIPADKPYLSYWYWIVSSESVCGTDLGGVAVSNVFDNVVDRLELCEATQTEGWVHRVVDLQNLAGQVADMEFLIGTFGSQDNSNLLIDDVGFQPSP